ncbi:hypothetical protein PISMIDRAFT_675319 [Pisolithus microcarpus 441]|uniref:Uncharacterized protein n=1 Tax=Pisolithus microcarpus 441 TaxID=765257 RepID=A0A0C9ZXV6_9AGAM|nr:hypothetical protein PISMIDRAFT_675319 [Pisolithus microcarpus 441]
MTKEREPPPSPGTKYCMMYQMLLRVAMQVLPVSKCTTGGPNSGRELYQAIGLLELPVDRKPVIHMCTSQ